MNSPIPPSLLHLATTCLYRVLLHDPREQRVVSGVQLAACSQPDAVPSPPGAVTESHAPDLSPVAPLGLAHLGSWGRDPHPRETESFT